MPNARLISYRAAILEALFEEMDRDKSVVLIGEDVGAAGGVFKQTDGLFSCFGAARVIDTPISEPGAFGIAVGAAMTGLRPIFEVMFGDFLTLVMDQLVNQAAKVHYMSAGTYKVPLVLRTTMGLGSNLGPQHSQNLYAWVAHVPGLKVLIPSSPADAKGLYKSAIRDDNPVLIFEDRMLYEQKGEVSGEDYVLPLGSASIRRVGSDVTVVALGRMVVVALSAAEELSKQGIEVEVIDPRTLVPLDLDTIIQSVCRTGRAVVIDGGTRQFGASAELTAAIAQGAFDWLDAPVIRLAAEAVPIPFSRTLEPLVQPDAQGIVSAILSLMARETPI